MAGFGAILRAEAAKAGRQKIAFGAVGAAVAAAASMPPALRILEDLSRLQGGSPASRTGFEALSLAAGSGLLLGAILLAVMAALSLAGEAAAGTMRTALVRPVRRRDWFLAKAAVLAGAVVLVVVLVWIAGILSAAAAFSFGDVRDPDFPSWVFLEEAAMWAHVRRVALMSIGPLLSLVGVGLLFSSLTDNPTYALAATIGAAVLAGPILGSFATDLRPYLVFGYPGEWLRVLREIAGGYRAEEAAIALTARNCLLPAAVAAGGVLAAGAIVSRRDVLV